jgi:hypothetical protein
VLPAAGHGDGGGLHFAGAFDVLEVTDTSFTRCHALKGGGGGMLLAQHAGRVGLVQNSVLLLNCSWLNNSAENGGSVAFSSIGVDVFFDECTFQHSVGTVSGGSLWARGRTAVNIFLQDSIIYQSRAEQLDGGAVYAHTITLTLINTIVGQTSGECRLTGGATLCAIAI